MMHFVFQAANKRFSLTLLSASSSLSLARSLTHTRTHALCPSACGLLFPNCIACTDATRCLKCNASFPLFEDGACVPQCSASKYAFGNSCLGQSPAQSCYFSFDVVMPLLLRFAPPPPLVLALFVHLQASRASANTSLFSMLLHASVLIALVCLHVSGLPGRLTRTRLHLLSSAFPLFRIVFFWQPAAHDAYADLTRLPYLAPLHLSCLDFNMLS